MIFEPKWKSLLATTVGPIFTPAQCQNIINIGRQQKTKEAQVEHKEHGKGTHDPKMRVATISWIPFKEMTEIYRDIETTMLKANNNHFGFDGMRLTEVAQFTEYSKRGFYDWHTDAELNCRHEPPVRKISMTILLSNQSEFEGGNLEFMNEDADSPQLIQGQAIFFCSLIPHRVAKVKRGTRCSLVMWFGGPPFK